MNSQDRYTMHYMHWVGKCWTTACGVFMPKSYITVYRIERHPNKVEDIGCAECKKYAKQDLIAHELQT